MKRRLGQLISAYQLGQSGRIITAVVVMGVLLLLAAVPLVRGLEKNARLAEHVSEDLVPTANRVMTLVKTVLEAGSGLEAYLLTGDEVERERFNDAVETVHLTLAMLASEDVSAGFQHGADVAAHINGVRDLVKKLEIQAEEVFELREQPDNVPSAHLINTRGEQLLTRTNLFLDLIIELRMSRDRELDVLFLSALMGYQDSLNRMMGSVRGYLFMRETAFRDSYLKEFKRNETIYAIIEQRLRDGGDGAAAFFHVLDASRTHLLDVFERSFAERDRAGWRRDFDYYQTQINPTLESLKWVLYTLSDSTGQEITQISNESMQYSQMLRHGALIGALLIALIGGGLGFWIYRCVGVFTRQIGDASVQLNQLSEQLRRETEQHAREANSQVEVIGGVHRTLTEFRGALSQIRAQTEVMAQQTDSASLECVQGMEVLSNSQERMGAILTHTMEISHAMEETKLQTKQMDGILAILDELVDQTKLLSFNATIEAAGAGKSGTRFAMVAKHVRRLATRSQEATQEIRAMIKKVQETTEETRKATERGTRAVSEGENLMNVVTERLDVIVGAVSQVSDVAGSIFLATQAQEHAIGDVDRFAKEAADTAGRVSERTTQSLGTAEELQRTAQNLSRLVGK